MKMERIVYIGGFKLPDKNAAALRVISNAKALREIGHEVVFLNAVEDQIEGTKQVQYGGFTCFEYKRESLIKYLVSYAKIIDVIKKVGASVVIAYNYPAVALNRLRKYCKKHNIRCMADVTEWYVPQGNLLYKIVKGLDSEFRMRYIHPRLSGIIAVSDYLYTYYKGKVPTVKIPPLVDIREEKWECEINFKQEGTRFIYAGMPSAQKEKLNLIIEAVEKIGKREDVYLDVVGITQEQYNTMYNTTYEGEKTVFWGRISNREVIRMIKESNWTIILRENNKVVKAGFPTKLVESLACGTPVIINRFSNVEDYLEESNSIIVEDMGKLDDEVVNSINRKTVVNREVFDYHNFMYAFKLIISEGE